MEEAIMKRIKARGALPFLMIPMLGLLIAACAGRGPAPAPEAPAPAMPAPAPPPPGIAPSDLVGAWGLASYHKEEDRERTAAAARAQCSKPYVITRGPTGGVMMHLADATQPSELRLKAGSDGRAYVGPEGPAPEMADREIVAFDGRQLILRWVDPEVAGRYGTLVFVRCGVPGTGPRKKSAKR
jgi:hypothetical protein